MAGPTRVSHCDRGFGRTVGSGGNMDVPPWGPGMASRGRWWDQCPSTREAGGEAGRLVLSQARAASPQGQVCA